VPVFRRFGAAQVLAAASGAIPGLAKDAHRAVFHYVPREGYLYVRSRAISSRTNDNWDCFPAEEIAKSYQTFIGRPVFVNHVNEDHRHARGVVIDAALHRDRNPDGSPDTWCECLMEIDAIRFPKLAQAILNGDIDRTSMGTDVAISTCSFCGNKATTPLEYCAHIPGKKGKRIRRRNPDGRFEDVLVFEICSGLSFFENSLLVEPPADPTAYFLDRPVLGPGLEHLQQKVASLEAVLSERPATNLASLATPRHARPRLTTPSHASTLPLQYTASNGINPYHRQGDDDPWFQGNDKPKTPEQIAADKAKGREMGERLWEGFHQVMDPGSTPESRKSTRNIGVMNDLQGLGYQPHHIKFDPDDDDHPYAHIEGPRGWYAIDHSGPHLEIRHQATGDESHDLIDLQHYDRETRNQHRMPGYGPAEAEQDLHHWVNGDPEETGGYAAHLEQHDPRIRRWQQRHRAGMERRMFAEHPSGYRAEWTGGNRYHIYEGDQPVDSPPLPGYSDAMSSSEAAANRDRFGQHHLERGLHKWVRDNGAEYMSFNHPEIEPMSYADRARMRDLDRRQGASKAEAPPMNTLPDLPVARRRTTKMSEEEFDAHLANVRSVYRSHGENNEHPDGQPMFYKAPSKKITETLPRTEQVQHAAQHGYIQGQAKRWSAANPLSAEKFVTSWNGLSRAQKAHAKVWYAKEHDTLASETKHINRARTEQGFHPIHPLTLNAINTISSAGTEYHQQKATAHAIAVSDDPYGKDYAGGGYHLNGAARGQIRRLLDGAEPTEVIRSNKFSDFHRHIANSGDQGEKRYVMDRQTYAAGSGNMPDYAWYHHISSQLGNKGGYEAAQSVARTAHDMIGKQDRRKYRSDHLQAGWWYAGQQRQAADENETRRTVTTRLRSKQGLAATNKSKLHDLLSHHHGRKTADAIVGALPTSSLTSAAMVQALAYNETKAPQDVDTLRDERCAICGNDTAFDGRECLVCGYLAPPKALGDPDVDKARHLDELKRSVDDALLDVDPSRKGADFEAGDTEDVQAQVAGEGGPSTLGCPVCGMEYESGAPTTEGGQPEGPAEGDVCPNCNKGLLEATGQGEEEEPEPGEEEQPPEGSPEEGPLDTSPIPSRTTVTPEEVPEDEEEDEEEPEEEDEEEEQAQTPPAKRPVPKKSAAAKYRASVKEFDMQHALAALAELQELVEHQQRENLKLQRRLSVKDSQIQRLTAGLQAIAMHLGPDVDTLVRTAMVRKHADEQNPAQPVIEPRPEPPSQSTPDALEPEAFADVNAPGMVPGVNQDVAADAVTTAYTPGQDLPSPAVKQLVDVTRPIDGTQGPRPLRETKTEVDVRAGNTMNSQVAFPLGGPFGQAQRTGSLDGGEDTQLRFMAALRLARLQIAAGYADGEEDLALAQKIANSTDIAAINAEIGTLNKVAKAAAKRQGQPPPRRAVPRSAGQARTVPSLAGQAPLRREAAQRDDDLDLSLVLLGDALSGE
jgi:hypothetical protein